MAKTLKALALCLFQNVVWIEPEAFTNFDWAELEDFCHFDLMGGERRRTRTCNRRSRIPMLYPVELGARWWSQQAGEPFGGLRENPVASLLTC